MRLTLNLGLIAAFGFAATFVACDDDGGSNPGITDTMVETDTTENTDTMVESDTMTEDDTSIVDNDTMVEEDTSTVEDDTSVEQDTTTEVTCDYNGITGDAYIEYSPDNGYLTFGLAGATEELSLQFYDLGAGLPITGAGTYEFGTAAGEDNYKTCLSCALIYTEDTVYFATSGSVTVTTIDMEGLTVEATVNDLVLVEVTIADDYLSTPVDDGGVWCVDEAAISYVPECTENADCTEAGKTFCDIDNAVCVGCLSDLDCSAELPVCGADDNGDVMCLAGIDLCTGDDAAENGDDGPLGATALTLGADVSAKICGEAGTATGAEYDWYTFTLTETSNIQGSLSFGADYDIDVYFADADISVIDSGATEANPETFQAIDVPAGTYYIIINSYAGAPTEAVDYTLNVSTFTPECTEDVDCTDAAKPACDTTNLVCVACTNAFHCTDAAAPACVLGDDDAPVCGVVDECTMDDDREHGDDGPAGATDVSLPATDAIDGMICGESGEPSGAESDFFKFALGDGESVDISVAWANEDADLDFEIYDVNGTFVDDAASIANPEVLSFAPDAAGEFFVVLFSYDDNATGGLDYNITMDLISE